MVKTKVQHAIFCCTVHVTSNAAGNLSAHARSSWVCTLRDPITKKSTVNMPFLTIKTTGQWKISITIGVDNDKNSLYCGKKKLLEGHFNGVVIWWCDI